MNALNQTISGGLNTALVSLEREYRRVLTSPEGIRLGRLASRLTMGDGWSEPRATGVLVEALARWLGRDAVTAMAFYANGGPAVEVFAVIGDHWLAWDGFKHADDMMAWCCEKHRARFSQSKFAEFDTKNPGNRMNWGDANCEKAAAGLAELLGATLDQDIARLVLGV